MGVDAMKREIKFRIWDKIFKNWLDYEEFYINQEGEVYLIEEREWAYQTYMHKENASDNVAICQYTGLKDKNGKEIYEGDILECHHKTKGIVFFHDGSFRLSSDQCELNLEDICTYDDLNQDLVEDNNLVIVSNIYENPELLEQSK
jgi:uncharacterized phage protein (TIGR01671 family)